MYNIAFADNIFLNVLFSFELNYFLDENFNHSQIYIKSIYLTFHFIILVPHDSPILSRTKGGTN